MAHPTSFKNTLRLAFVVSVFTCALAACGGGSGGASGSGGTGEPPVLPTKINPEGIWRGIATSTSNELSAQIVADGTGTAYAILNSSGGLPAEALYMSGFTPENFIPKNLVSSGDGYYRHVAGGFYESVGSAAVTVQGGATQKNLQFQVSTSLSGANPRNVSVNYSTQYDTNININTIVGNYRSTNTSNTIYDLNISNVNSNAMLISSNPACVFSNSRISASNNSKNIFSIVGIFSGTACAFQGPVMGVAFADFDNNGQVSAINIALRATDGKRFYVFQGNKI